MDFVWNTKVQSTRTGADRKSATAPWGVGEVGVINYVDGTSQDVRLTELSDANHSVSWEVVSSNPPVAYSSAVHTVRLRRVTTNNSTFIEWESNFSKDASSQVLEDARYKARDAFDAIRAEAAKQFTFHSTAEDVVKTVNVKGRVFLVTGGNSGIGYEAVRVLAGAGAKVIFTARDDKKIAETVAELKKGQANADVQGLVCSLDSLKSIRAFAANYAKLNLPLHVLILNAGVMACPYSLTEDKFEMQIGTNHIGHHLLTTLLLPIIKKSAPARVVVLSSGAHRRHNVNFDDLHWSKPGSYEPWFAYGSSKTANILFAKHLNALMKKEGVAVTANALHPGVIVTNLGRHIAGGMASFAKPPGAADVKAAPAAAPAPDTKADTKTDAKPAAAPAVPFIPRMKSIPQGAATTLVAAVLPQYATEGGLYLSDCNPLKPLPYAADMAAAERLWKLTEDNIAAASKLVAPRMSGDELAFGKMLAEALAKESAADRAANDYSRTGEFDPNSEVCTVCKRTCNIFTMRPALPKVQLCTICRRKSTPELMKELGRYGKTACNECGTPKAAEKKALQRCGRCQNAWYCDQTCQMKAWAYHKAHCFKPGTAPPTQSATPTTATTATTTTASAAAATTPPPTAASRTTTPTATIATPTPSAAVAAVGLTPASGTAAGGLSAVLASVPLKPLAGFDFGPDTAPKKRDSDSDDDS